MIGGELHAEGVALSEIAERFGTPCYVYSKTALVEAMLAFQEPLHGRDHLICYAMKANSNLSILRLFAGMGGGFDIVSGGELQRVIAAGGDPGKVVFSGVGKSEAEIRLALEKRILCFNVESRSELLRIARIAAVLGVQAPISLRVNPDVDAGTHPYISTGLKENKFGIPLEDARALYGEAAGLPSLKVVGVDCHIGSQITEIAPFVDALGTVLELVRTLESDGIHLHHIDVGGGLGIRYDSETPPSPRDYLEAITTRLAGFPQKLLLEPGRALVGNAGLLLTRVEYLKPGEAKNFAVVDAAMNDLARPALYQAYHAITAVRPRAEVALSYDVVGPVCESGDFLGLQRNLALREGDLLAVHGAGAYGMSMASNYNTRSRPVEIMVDAEACQIIRKRESMGDLLNLERELGSG